MLTLDSALLNLATCLFPLHCTGAVATASGHHLRVVHTSALLHVLLPAWLRSHVSATCTCSHTCSGSSPSTPSSLPSPTAARVDAHDPRCRLLYIRVKLDTPKAEVRPAPAGTRAFQVIRAVRLQSIVRVDHVSSTCSRVGRELLWQHGRGGASWGLAGQHRAVCAHKRV